jgi:uncharacterized DUF497 family protein
MESARRHGIPAADILHAVEHPIRYREQEYAGELRVLVIGADQTGRLLEIVLVPAATPTRIIHADTLRPGRYDYL